MSTWGIGRSWKAVVAPDCLSFVMPKQQGAVAAEREDNE
jgi:hypothetical protein